MRLILPSLLSVLQLASCGGRTHEPRLDDGGAGTTARVDSGTGDRGAGASAPHPEGGDGGSAHGGAISGGSGGGAGTASSGGAPPLPPDDAGPVHDASFDGAPTGEPSCACPPGDYYIDLAVAGTSHRLSYPYALNLFCRETTVQVSNNGCDDAYRITGCAGPDSAPPCVYVGVLLGEGPLIGHYLDENGATFPLSGATLSIDPGAGRSATGHFDAQFADGDGGLAVFGDFVACRTLFPAYPCSGGG